MMRRSALSVGLCAALLLGGCGGTSGLHATPATSTARPGPDHATLPGSGLGEVAREARRLQRLNGTRPPLWLGTRVLPRTPSGYGEPRPTPPELRNRRFTLPDRSAALPGNGFAARVTSPVPAVVLARSTWQPSCPVTARQLAWIRLSFWGFDNHRHTGELLVNAGAASLLVKVFRLLYDARYPIEEMRITSRAELTAPPTGDGNDTGAFVCRATTGETTYSQHAHGLAIDVNPFQNPYLNGDVVLPELAGAYRERSRTAPGMIHPDGVVVRAFASIGWQWGGAWHSLKDYQHFSANGR